VLDSFCYLRLDDESDFKEEQEQKQEQQEQEQEQKQDNNMTQMCRDTSPKPVAANMGPIK
jgi:hypothetical protein